MIAVPVLAAAIGLAMQCFVIRRIIDGPMIMSLLATFAMSAIIVNVSLLIWGGEGGGSDEGGGTDEGGGDEGGGEGILGDLGSAAEDAGEGLAG